MTREEIKIRQLTNQYLITPDTKLTVVRDLCGIQCQFMVNAFHSLKIRCNDYAPETVSEGLVKNWTLRGTVHVFAESDLPLFVRCDNGTRYKNEDFYGFYWWRKPDGSYVYREEENCELVYCLTPEREKYFLHIILNSLANGAQTREALKDLCRENGMTDIEEESFFYPWGGAIATFCNRGFLNHVVQEKKAFCLAPEYTPLTDDVACMEIARRYFTNFGPATVHDAMYFLGAKQYQVKQWMEKFPLKSTECDGKTYYYIENGKKYNKDIPECLFLAGFDQLMLGYQKTESLYLPQEHLRGIFNLAGIVMPPILLRGKVVGKWKKKNKNLTLTLFESLSDKDVLLIKNTAEQQWQDIKKLEIT